MANLADRLVWIDCEMTGLDLSVDELVEIAVVITDFDLTPVAPGIDLVIKPSAAALEQMGEFVTNMHTTSGLITELDGGLSLEEAERQVLEYVRTYVPEAKKAPLAGNSIGTDRSFLAKYMPELDDHLHYRNIDVSSIKELAHRWYPRVYFRSPEKDGGHRALADILESIRELAYYRAAAFVAEPGPTSDEAKAIAETVVAKYAPEM
ncbi:oligoribonuclease [Mycetocola tolaasinivorans]|uniref:Oligoribonuclease n=1 Tax=Mycetocola tolaasinivorans TaxID=76635 RepID=A0A3L7A456_9MICO|nr:oligoribonuclease [Mycetocola tolaasinivorans]RLP74987.1 oligoribonuclease [Mycetocola tolaasinivorans]